MIMKSTNCIRELINLYLTEIDECVLLLKRKYNSKDIFLDLKSKKIPRQGMLSNNIEFQFHGIGCRFDFPDGKSVDFDFGYAGRTDGFSLGWLTNFVENNCLDKFPHYLDSLILKHDFEELEKNGVIVKSTYPHDDLYYLVAKLQ